MNIKSRVRKLSPVEVLIEDIFRVNGGENSSVALLEISDDEIDFAKNRFPWRNRPRALKAIRKTAKRDYQLLADIYGLETGSPKDAAEITAKNNWSEERFDQRWNAALDKLRTPELKFYLRALSKTKKRLKEERKQLLELQQEIERQLETILLYDSILSSDWGGVLLPSKKTSKHS